MEKLRDIKSKKPWRRIRPDGYAQHGAFSSIDSSYTPTDVVMSDIATQADFIREYYPSGHAINDPRLYPDIWREEEVPVLDADGEDTGKVTRRLYCEKIPRYAFAFQQIITVKHLVHLCGNDIQFELNSKKVSDDELETFTEVRVGWLSKDMELAFYESAKSVKRTGDTAFVGYMSNNEFHWKVLSYFDGDTLYPHFDSATGKLKLFARSFNDYDENGEEMTEWLEVWDDIYLSRYKQGKGKGKSIKEKILGAFGLDGYTLVERKPHGFPFIPISYHRNNDGPCWTFSQDTIEDYEVTYSQMAHNNQMYGEPIMVLMAEGDNVNIMKNTEGTIKAISINPDEKVDYLQAQSASESYMKQQESQYKMILSQSFIVEPPELKSGDLPAAALKILYSPAIEIAMDDCKMYQRFLNGMVEIFLYGYGMEKEKTIDFTNLDMKWWIEPYVHVNTSTIVADLAAAVQNGFISKQTASERMETLYATNSEWDRIMREAKEQQEADLLYQLKTMKGNAPTNTTANK